MSRLRAAFALLGCAWAALLRGRARLTGGLFSAHVLRRPAASSPFTSLRRVPRLAAPRMAFPHSTFAGMAVLLLAPAVSGIAVSGLESLRCQLLIFAR